MSLMKELSTNLSVEIDFLEWLDKKFDKPIDLKSIPTSVFEILVDDYST